MFDSKLNSLLVLSVTKSITKTAEIVNLTQPSVTAQIRALEDEYEIKITKKIGNELILTPEGKILIKNAEKIKSAYMGAERDIKNYKSKMKTLKIGVTSGVESTFISSVLAKLAALHDETGDKLNISIIYNDIDALVKMLQYYTIDLVISDDEAESADIKKINLDSDDLVYITSPKSETAHLKKITLEEIQKHKLIVRLPNSSTRILFDAILRTHNMTLNDFDITLELNSVSSIKNLVKNNVSGAILTKNACLNEIKKRELKVIPIEGISHVHCTDILYLKDFAHEEIAEQIKELYTQSKA